MQNKFIKNKEYVGLVCFLLSTKAIASYYNDSLNRFLKDYDFEDDSVSEFKNIFKKSIENYEKKIQEFLKKIVEVHKKLHKAYKKYSESKENFEDIDQLKEFNRNTKNILTLSCPYLFDMDVWQSIYETINFWGMGKNLNFKNKNSTKSSKDLETAFNNIDLNFEETTKQLEDILKILKNVKVTLKNCKADIFKITKPELDEFVENLNIKCKHFKLK